MNRSRPDPEGPPLPASDPLRNTLDRARMAAVRLDARGAVTWCNEPFLLLAGVSRRDAIGADWAGRFLPPEESRRVRALLSGSVPRFSCPLLPPGGSPRCVDWSHLVEYDGHGSPVGTLLLGEEPPAAAEDGSPSGEGEDRWDGNRVLLDNLPAPALLLRGETYEIVAANRAAVKEGARVGETCYRSWRKRESPCLWCLAPSVWSTGVGRELSVDVGDRILDTRWVPERQGRLLHYAFDVTESVRVADRLQRSEERYRRLFEEAPVPMMEADASGMRGILSGLAREYGEGLPEYLLSRPDEVARCLAATRILDVNREALRLYEAPGKEELLANGLGTLTLPGSYGPVGEAMASAISGRLSLHFETPTRFGEGSARIVNAWISIPPPYAESWSRVVLTLQDVTARREMEKSLLESERLFRDTFDRSGAAIAHMAPGGRFLSVNRRYCEMVGYTREELLARTFFEITHPEDRPGDEAAYRRLVAGETGAVSNEKRYLRKDGSVVWANRIVGAVRDAEGTVKYFVGVLEDVSGRKRMEEALREGEARFRSLVESTSDWIWRIDARGRYTYSSPRVTELLGYEPAELLGKTPFRFMPPKERRRIRAEFRRSAAAREPLRGIETVALHKDGREVILETNGVPLFDGSGALVGYQGVDRDIGERKRVERELTRTGEELRRLSAHLQTVVEEERRRIAREIHDILGQGLIGLRLDTSWLSEGLLPSQWRLKQRAGEMLGSIDATIDTVKRITSELRPRLLDDLGLGAAIEWQAGDFQKRSGIPCRVSLLPKEIVVRGDVSTALFRIFQETLSNVVQHSGATLVRVRLAKTEETVELTVRDNGVGIPKEKIGHPRSLGLLGIRERALLLGGSARVRRAGDHGTTVTVRIPLGAPQEGGEEGRTLPEGP